MTTSDLRKAAQAVFDAFCASGSIHIDIIRSLGAPMKELGAALAQPDPDNSLEALRRMLADAVAELKGAQPEQPVSAQQAAQVNSAWSEADEVVWDNLPEQQDDEVYRQRALLRQASRALVRAKDGYISENATGLPVLPLWRSETLHLLTEAIQAISAHPPAHPAQPEQQAEPVAWMYRFHTDESLKGGHNVRPWVLSITKPPDSTDIEVRGLVDAHPPAPGAATDKQSLSVPRDLLERLMISSIDQDTMRAVDALLAGSKP